MDREDILKFTNSIIIVSKLLTKIEDKFVAQKLYDKISDVIFAFIEYKKFDDISEKSVLNQQAHTSHNIKKNNLIISINNVIDFLEYISHHSTDNTTPLLLGQRNLLKFKLHNLKQKSSKVGKSRGISAEILKITDPILVDTQTLKPDTKIKSAKLEIKADSNKERIFDFIKKSPHIRARDVIDKFKILSNRTVKRNLKELTENGFLRKKSADGTVYYLPADWN